VREDGASELNAASGAPPTENKKKEGKMEEKMERRKKGKKTEKWVNANRSLSHRNHSHAAHTIAHPLLHFTTASPPITPFHVIDRPYHSLHTAA
jgi:hypothetical protein